MIILKCDKCGKESEPQKNDFPRDGWDYIIYTARQERVTKHLCPECRKQLEIPSYSDHKPTRYEYMGEQIIDIITQISQESNQPEH